MTPEKAIEIQEAYIEDGAYEGTDEFMSALKLGIEALKERVEARRLGFPLWHELLPGETKE